MKYTLLILCVFLYLTHRSYKWTLTQGDNFGAALWPIVCAVISVISAVVLICQMVIG